MKSLIKAVFYLCVISLISISPSLIAANEIISEPDQESQNQLQADFDQLYRAYENLDNYQITVSFYNVDDNRLISQNKVVGNRQTGDAHFSLTLFQERADGQVDPVTFDLLAYRYFDMVYINFPHLLKESHYFDQVYFDPAIARAFGRYDNYYTAIEGSELTINASDSLLQSLAFLPDLDQLALIDPDHIYRLGHRSMIDMERLEIPRDLFANAGKFHLNYQANLEIEPVDDPHKDYKVATQHALALNQNNTGVGLEFNMESNITEDLLPVGFTEEIQNYYFQERIRSTDVTDKLTKATIAIDPDNLLYRAVLTGLFEEMSLNIFTSEPAGFESYNHRMIIEISPSQEPIPSPASLQKMSLDEFNYILEELLSQPHIESPLLD